MRLIHEFSWDVPAMADAIGVSHEAAIKLFKNGRLFTYMLRPRLAADLRLQEVGGVNAPAHLIDKNGNQWAVRSLTDKSGVSFCPQSMIGTGRHFEHRDFIDYLKTIFGFFVCDVTMFPKMRVYEITSDEILLQYNQYNINDGRLTFQKFKRLNGYLSK